MAEEKRYRIWMHPLWPNLADPRWYPHDKPEPEEGSHEWALRRVKELRVADPWSPWAYQVKPSTWPTVCDEPTPSGRCTRPSGHREGCESTR